MGKVKGYKKWVGQGVVGAWTNSLNSLTQTLWPSRKLQICRTSPATLREKIAHKFGYSFKSLTTILLETILTRVKVESLQ